MGHRVYKAKNLPFFIFFNKISIKYITLFLFYNNNSYVASYCKRTCKTCRQYATHVMTVTICERYATQLITHMSHEVRAQSADWSADMRADTPSLSKHFVIRILFENKSYLIFERFLINLWRINCLIIQWFSKYLNPAFWDAFFPLYVILDQDSCLNDSLAEITIIVLVTSLSSVSRKFVLLCVGSLGST